MIRTIFVAALLAFVAVGNAQAQQKVRSRVTVGDMPPVR